MGESSNQRLQKLNDSSLRENISSNHVLFRLEKDGFTTPDEKAKELINVKGLTEINYLYALKLLFEDLQNKFSDQVLTSSLIALADPTPFSKYTSKESVTRLELHLRTWKVVLERIYFSQLRLTKELRDNAYNSLAKFAIIHKKATRVTGEGLENNFPKRDDKYVKKRNYNCDFLLTHLRDTLHSLRDDETCFQEIIRRIKKVLIAATSSINPSDVSPRSSISSILTQLHQGLSFKYPIASYYVNWRIMLVIQYNLLTEKIVNKESEEEITMEYLWSHLNKELINNKSTLDSQTKFEEMLNKVTKALRSTGSFLNGLSGSEPLALPHTLWFGILDLAQNLIQESTQINTYRQCYYLATESLNNAPSSFIQFKAAEVLLYLSNTCEYCSIIDVDFDQYSQKLDDKNNSEKFQNLLMFVREKYLEDFNVLNDAREG